MDRMSEMAAQLTHERVDIILGTSTPATMAAKQATSTIPIVMVGTLDAQAVGLVTNLARPGGNITGLTEISIELIGKRLQLLKEAVPGVSRLGFLGGRLPADTGTPSALDRFNLSVSERIVREMDVAGKSLGMTVQVGILGAVVGRQVRCAAAGQVQQDDPVTAAVSGVDKTPHGLVAAIAVHKHDGVVPITVAMDVVALLHRHDDLPGSRAKYTVMVTKK